MPLTARDSPGTSTAPTDAGRPRVLYLSHRVPYPPDKGDRIRSFHLIRWLSRRCEVHLACLADEPVAVGAVPILGRFCHRITIAPIGGAARWIRALGALARGRTASEGGFSSPSLRATIRRWVRETRFDICLASASSLVPYLRSGALRDIPSVVDILDVDSQKWMDYATTSRGPLSWLYRIEGRRLRRLEQMIPGWARAVTLVSDAEADLYRRFCDPGQIHAVPHGIDVNDFRPRPGAAERGCVFVGALDYRPNVEGISWFCRHVWPEVRERCPEARIALVGRRPTPAIRELGRLPGVDLIGQVPDVRPYLEKAAVAVVPLQMARGVPTKVLEALAMGKAVLASPQALFGIGARPETDLLIAESREDWIDAVVRLLADEALRRRLGDSGRRYVAEHHHWERCLAPFGPLIGLPREDAG